YKAPAFAGQQLVVRTWVGQATAATWERHSEVRRIDGDKLLVTCRSVYVALDPATARPRRIDPVLTAPFLTPSRVPGGGRTLWAPCHARSSTHFMEARMSARRPLSTLAFSLGLAACAKQAEQTAAAPPAVDSAAVRTAVSDVWQKWIAADTAGNYTALIG